MRICLPRPRILTFRHTRDARTECTYIASRTARFHQSPKFRSPSTKLNVTEYSTLHPVAKEVEVLGTNFASETTDTTSDESVKNNRSGPNDSTARSPLKLKTNISGPKRTSPEAWMKLTYPFLPAELRSKLPENQITDSVPDCKDRKILSRLLRNARAQKIDLLAYLGLERGYWQESMYLVETLLVNIFPTAQDEDSPQLLSNIQWPEEEASASLRDLCYDSFEVELKSENNRAEPENAMGWWKDGPSDKALLNREFRLAMREIWQSLGSLVIAASDMPLERMRSAMGWVYQIIAQLHHGGMIPDSIYQYEIPRFTSSTVRSPVIHMLSTRILTALSDTAFTKESREIPGMAYRLKGGDPFPNVWLEFVLWCSIDNGYVEESIWILEQLKGNASFSKWRLVDWTEYEQESNNDAGWVFGKSRDQSLQRFLEQTEERTLSSQVVTAVLDGLISNIQNHQLERHDMDAKLSAFPGRLYSLLSMLKSQSNTSMDSTSFDRLFMRILDSSGFSVQQIAPSAWESLHQIESFRPAPKRDPDNLSEMSSPLSLDLVIRAMNPVPSVLHQLIENFSRLGDSRRALAAFDDIQLRIDESRKRNITLFGKRLDSLEQLNASYHGAAAEGYFVPTGEIPDRVLAFFLNTLTEGNHLDFGNWLLYSADMDGPVIHPGRYSSPQLGPALIRFARATGDRKLLSRVLDAAPSKPSVAFLHEALNSRLALHDFDLAERILGHLRRDLVGSYGEKGGYRVSNLSTLAAALIRLKHVDDRDEKAAGCYEAGLSLFERMLRGDYRNQFNYGTEFEAFKDHLVSNVLRILQSFPNPLQGIIPRYSASYKTSRRIRLPAHVFHPLLSAVTDIHGSVEAKRLWKLHCQNPSTGISGSSEIHLETEAMVENITSDGLHAEHWRLAYDQPARQTLLDRTTGSIPFTSVSQESVSTPTVSPDLWTLRIIVRGALNELTASTKTKAVKDNTAAVQDVLDWSVVIFKEFGLRLYDVYFEYGNARSTNKMMYSDRISKLYKGQIHLLH